MTEMFKTKGWFSGGLWKPKNPHSLEHLKYLYHVLSKNQVVYENNRSLLVETLRSIAEILIWGDQNDSTVFDFFLEKNMLSYFLIIMKQKCGRYVCVQLLQTLNILFENIRNETSLYYLLSNNHVNSIIVHKFDFSDEEVLAYYISFLKTLSLKLNTHTIHFFYNEHTNDFPLYTEAIKFFNHSESMVRIAVRTLTLNVYKVDDKSMLKFIRDKTAAPYFSNLVWFIGNHILELDCCVRNDADHQSRDRLADLVAEHLDHLHYLNDILCLNIDTLNEVLTDHLLNKLLVPLYVYSLTKRRRHSQIEDDRPHVSSVVGLFLLSQVFLIISHPPLVRQLADIILNGDMSIFSESSIDKQQTQGPANKFSGFIAPSETLVQSLESSKARNKPFRTIKRPNYRNSDSIDPAVSGIQKISIDSGVSEASSITTIDGSITPPDESSSTDDGSDPVFYGGTDLSSPNLNSTDEEKQLAAAAAHRYEQLQPTIDELQSEFTLANRPYLEAIFNALECTENDYAALFALCLLYALGHNQGINQDLLDNVLMPTDRSETKSWYNQNLVDRLIKILSLSCHKNCKVRLATLELTILLLKQLVCKNGRSYIQDRHLAASEDAKEESILLLRNFYKSEEMFLDMFEDEYRELKDRPLNVEYLTMDSSILLPPTGTPLTGIEFSKRLPCGDVERARRAIRGFFLLRDLSFTMRSEKDTQLPLTKDDECVKVSNVLDLNNSDLIACTVIHRDSNQRVRRFLVIDVTQMILVEPDSKRLGWGIAKFVGFLQDIEVTGDKEDSRSLHIVIHKPSSTSSARHKTQPLLAARFIFDDHIRCMAAKQRLTKGRLKARQMKMHMIAKLLDLPYHVQPCPSPPVTAIASRSTSHHSLTGSASAPGSHPLQHNYPDPAKLRNQKLDASAKKVLHAPMSKVPGFAAMVRRDSGIILNAPVKSSSRPQATRYKGKSSKDYGSSEESGDSSDNSASTLAFSRMDAEHTHRSPKRSTSSSPRTRHRDSEEIPLEDFSKNRSARNSATGPFTPARSGSASPQRSPKNISPAGSLSHLDKNADKTPPSRRSSGSSPAPNKKSGRSASAPVQPSPKTLRPADAPPLSLIPTADEDNQGTLGTLVGSPKLLPPAEPDHVRYITDSSSEGDLKSSASDSTSDSCPVSETSFMEENGKEATVEVSISQASVKKDSPDSTIEQLTKLAQLVQEHYRVAEQEDQRPPSSQQKTASKIIKM